jgi:hypothetical protein
MSRVGEDVSVTFLVDLQLQGDESLVEDLVFVACNLEQDCNFHPSLRFQGVATPCYVWSIGEKNNGKPFTCND